jgi:hypothetical protein
MWKKNKKMLRKNIISSKNISNMIFVINTNIQNIHEKKLHVNIQHNTLTGIKVPSTALTQ